MQVLLLRHGRTPGNEKKRYIGVTDESLSALGRKDCENLCSLFSFPGGNWESFGKVQVVVSPMKRCQETAEILLHIKRRSQEQVLNGSYATLGGSVEVITDSNLRECNFGIFENKNYIELQQEPLYQQWIDSNGTMDFPKGDCLSTWKEQSVQAFIQQTKAAFQRQVELLIFIIHGGTIMSIMEALEEQRLGYYEYHVENGEGFLLEAKVEDENIKLSRIKAISPKENRSDSGQ